MNNPEAHNSNSIQPVKNGSVFEVKSESDLKLSSHQLYTEYSEQPLTEDVLNDTPQSTINQTRNLLINNPGLLQDDIARVLNISLFALSACTDRPEQIKLQEDECKVLMLSGLGKIVLNRREQRIERIVETIQNNKKARVEQYRKDQQEQLAATRKKIKITRNKNTKNLAQRAKRYKEKQAQEKILKAAEINKKREEIIKLDKQSWRAANNLVDKLLNKEQQEILPHLQLSNIAIGKEIGLSESAVQKIIEKTYKQLGLSSKNNLAIWALKHGVNFELPPAPDIYNLSTEIRQAALLSRLDPKLAARESGVSARVHSRRVERALSAVGAKNRIQLALMSLAYHFDFLPEEDLEKDDTPQLPEVLQNISDQDKKILSLMDRPIEVIAESLEVAKHVIWDSLKKSQDLLGVSNHEQLALALFDSGMSFNIKKPSQPLNQILTSYRLKIANLSHLPIGEMAQAMNMEPRKITSNLYGIKKQLGIDTKIQLALIVHQQGADKTESLVQKTRTELFFERSGIPSDMDIADIRGFLRALVTEKHLSQRQAECIELYYLSEQQPSWDDINKLHKVAPGSSTNSAKQGMYNIQEYLHEVRQKQQNPDYVTKRALKLCTILGIEPTPPHKLTTIIDEALGNTDKAELFKAYFLTGANYQWKDLAEQRKRSPRSIEHSYRVGLEQLRTHLGLN